MAESMTLRINGREVHVRGASPTTPLLDFLRASGWVGTKEGCAEGDCGACTVALRHKKGYEAVNSCLVPLGAVAGQEVVTVEGLAQNGELHPVQVAMASAGGSQCGYCTPGFVMSLFAAHYEGERGDAVLEGNLCRCTGYRPIREVLRALPVAASDDPFIAPAAPLESGHYSAGDAHFYNPTTLPEALELLQAYPGAKLIAGGTDLGVEINKFGRAFPVLVSLAGIPALHYFGETPEGLEIGASLPLSELEARLGDRLPLIATMLSLFAARQIRNRATVGGSLGTASPIGDLAPVLLAYDASLRMASLEGERSVPLRDFFTGYRQTVQRSGELIKSVTVPWPHAGRLEATYKVGKRGADDISTVAAAFSMGLERGIVTTARLAYGGVAATPARAYEVEAFLAGKPWTADTVTEAAALLRDAFTPLSDLRGSADYRRVLVGNLFEKFFYEQGGRGEAAA